MSSADDLNQKDGRPVNRTVFHISHIIVGFSIGYMVAANALLAVYSLLKAHALVWKNLWWTSSVMVLVLMFVLREAMDSVRSSVYYEKEQGKLVEVRKRRRHEVMVVLLKRLSVALLLGALVLTAVVKVGTWYAADLGLLNPLFSGKGLPPVGSEIGLGIISFLIAAVTLLFCEMILRGSQRYGFPLQVLCLFLPSACGVSFAMLSLVTFIR